MRKFVIYNNKSPVPSECGYIVGELVGRDAIIRKYFSYYYQEAMDYKLKLEEKYK